MLQNNALRLEINLRRCFFAEKIFLIKYII